MIDTHSHIYGSEFASEQEELVARCKNAGVEHVILPNVDVESLKEIREFHNKFPDFTSMMLGIHPTSIGEDYEKLLDFFDSEVDSDKWVAIGETGIDLYWDKTYLKEQKIAFEHQIDVAIEKNLPFCIHCRDSFAEIIDSLKKVLPKSDDIAKKVRNEIESVLNKNNDNNNSDDIIENNEQNNNQSNEVSSEVDKYWNIDTSEFNASLFDGEFSISGNVIQSKLTGKTLKDNEV